MNSATQCFRYEDYTVGWIAALPVELQAAIEILDQKHHDLPQNPGSSTIYTLGSIGPHNVVLACLSADRTGIGSAATIATEMRTTFPCLRFGLLVGVGGGVPSTVDIRLGDVVVGQSRSGQDAVIQYDFGKATTSGFRRATRLSPPPDILLNALSNYQARSLDPNGDLISHRFKPKKMPATLQKFPAPDMLFRATYNHVDGTTCERCERTHLYKSPDRDSRCIMVHYGTIASGNQVIKDGTRRDQLSKELGDVLCFEMEAAGVMNTFPSLVVRGICDYADSHKNKDWQRFAAQSAALYGKELLNIVPPLKSPLMPEAIEMAKSSRKLTISRSSPRLMKTSANLGNWSDHTQLVKHEFTIQSISEYDPLRTYRGFIRNRCPGTTQWILEHEMYLMWRAAKNSSCLWLTGKIGSGKTIAASTIIEELLRDDNELVLHYFYRYSHKVELTAMALLKSCIKQTLIYMESTNLSCSPVVKAYLQQYYGSNKNSYDFDEMVENAFVPLISTIDRMTLVIDGLDECDNDQSRQVLKLTRSLLKEPNRKVFISGRASLDISKSIPGSSCIHISEKDAKNDISEYVRWMLNEKMQEREITNNLEILQEIETTLSENADQMILWVKLQIENLWEDCFGDTEIREASKNLPKDLTETYNRCFRRISSDKGILQDYAAKILPWMLEAVKPLTMKQLRQALAIDPGSGAIHHGKMPSDQDTLRSCANLVVRNADEQVILAHHSVYGYLKDRIQLQQQESDTVTKEYLKLSTTITLAGVCMDHLLSKDYTLAVQQFDKGTTLRLEAPEISLLTTAIPRYMRSFLPQPKPIQVTLPNIKPKLTQTTTLPDFFHYAREQWPELTRGWNASRPRYTKFVNLALNANLTWRLHPWKPLGQSIDSHYFGLFGWSIVNNHESLFKLLFPNSRPLLREDLFTAPFYPYDGLNCVLLAARSDTPWVFQYIPRVSFIAMFNSEDRDGWTALHHAVNIRSKDLVAKLCYLLLDPAVPVSENTISTVGMAITKGYSEIVDILLGPTGLRLKATAAAIRNGQISLLEASLDVSKTIHIDTEEEIERATLDAVASRHWEAIGLVSTSLTKNTLVREMYWHPWRRQVISAVLRLTLDESHISAADFLQKRPATKGEVEDYLRSFADEILQSNNLAKCQCWFALSEKTPITFNHLLRLAIERDSSQQVDILLQLGVNSHALSKDRKTALEIASSNRQCDIVKILLKYEPRSIDNYSRLMKAAIVIDDLKLAKSLIGDGSLRTDLSKPDENCKTFLHQAGMIGSDEMFALLFEAGYKQGNWQSIDESGNTVLILAARAGNANKVESLCSRLCMATERAYLDRTDNDGKTALYHSCFLNNSSCTGILLKHGADPSILDNNGLTVLHNMVWSDDYLRVICLNDLIGHKQAYVDMLDARGATALHTAIQCENPTVTKMLLSYGASINIKDVEGRTPIHLAARLKHKLGDSPYTKALLSLSKDKTQLLDIQDRKGNTALHYAVESENVEAVEALVIAGARIDIQNNAGITPHEQFPRHTKVNRKRSQNQAAS